MKSIWAKCEVHGDQKMREELVRYSDVVSCPTIIGERPATLWGKPTGGMEPKTCGKPMKVRIIKLRSKSVTQNCDGRCLNGKYSCNCSCNGKCHGQGFCSCGK